MGEVDETTMCWLKENRKTSGRTEIDAKFRPIILRNFLPQLGHTSKDGDAQEDIVDVEGSDSVVSAVTAVVAAAALAAAGSAGVTVGTSLIGGLNVALAGLLTLDDLALLGIIEETAESRNVGGREDGAAALDILESGKLNTIERYNGQR